MKAVAQSTEREQLKERQMNAAGMRLIISLASLATALIAFMSIANIWIALGVMAGIFTVSAIVERIVWHRFADPEMRRLDLEDRVRNPPL
jgi:predicted signal transduction protein with EAL and GGDEF domain